MTNESGAGPSPGRIAQIAKTFTRAQALVDTAEFAAGAELLRQAHADCVALVGADDPETLAAQVHLAQALHRSGDLAAAEAQYLDAFRRFETSLGPAHADTISAGTHLVQVLVSRDRFDEALKLLDELHARCAGAFDPDHRVAMRVATDRAMLHIGLASRRGDPINGSGDGNASVALVGEVLALIDRLVSLQMLKVAEDLLEPLAHRLQAASAPITEGSYDIAVLERMARMHEVRGHWAAALPVRQRVLAHLRATRELDDRATCQAELDCASVFAELGEHSAARALREHAVDALAGCVGAVAPATLAAISALASTLQALGDAAAARVLNERLVHERTRQLGTHHPATVLAEAGLAEDLLALGDTVQAVALAEARALALLSDENAGLDLLRVASRVANVLLQAGRSEQARVLQAHLVEQLSARLGDEQEEVLAAKTALSVTLSALRDHAGARALCESVYRACRTRVGPGHPDTVTAGLLLAQDLQALGAGDAALRLRQQLAQEAAEALGADHPLVTVANSALAASLTSHKRLDEARPLAEAVLASQTVRYGPDGDPTLCAKAVLADVLQEQGATEEAGELLADNATILARKWGSDHPKTVSALSALAAHRFRETRFVEARYLLERVLAAHTYTQWASSGGMVTATGHLAVVLFRLGDWAACATHCMKLLQTLGADAAAGEDSYFLAAEATEMLRELGEQRPPHGFNVDEVLDALTIVSQRLQSHLELRDVVVVGQARDEYERMHRHWLAACMRWAPQRCIAPLVALHGLEVWSSALDHVRVASTDAADDPTSAAFTEARRVLAGVRSEIVQIHARITDLRGGELPLPGARHAPSVSSCELRRLLAQRDEAADLERTALATYARARSSLVARNAAFAAAALRPTPTELLTAAGLADDEALAVLFEADNSTFALVPTATGTATIVPLPMLKNLRVTTQRYLVAAALESRSVGRRGAVQASTAPTDVDDDPPTLSDLDDLGARAVWNRLRSFAPGAQRWCVVTGPGLHDTPLEFGRRGKQASFYCGLPALFRLRGARPYDTMGAATLVMAADHASDSDAPLPFVEAESEAIAAVLAASGVAFQRRDGSALLAPGSSATWLQIACHGRIEGFATDAAHGTLLLDQSAGVVLDPARASELPAGLREVVATACVGGVTGHTGSDALGLPAALGLRGVRLVGCLAPAPDLLMPLFAALLWHARFAENLPLEAALASARERLRSGDWPEAVVAVLRQAYAVRLRLVLQEVARLIDDPGHRPAIALAKSVLHGWLAPDDWEPDLSELDLAQQYCRNSRLREALVARVLRRLVDGRRSPDATLRDQIEHVCVFSICWG